MPSSALRLALLVLVAALVGLGLTMIASTTVLGTAVGHSDGSVTYAYLLRQLAAIGVGVVAAGLLSVAGTTWLQRPWTAWLLAGAAAASVFAVLLFGRTINGAKRWLDFGPINVQPAEFAKLALVLSLACLLANAGERIRTLRWGLLQPLLIFAVLAGLVYLTKDLGSVIVMALTVLALLVCAGAPWPRLALIALSALPLLLYFTVWEVAYRRERFFAFLDPWQAAGPAAYHLQQSFIAISSGGISGVGLGQGSAALAFLPERHTDFIYAVICEELGMIGGLGVALLFLALIALGLTIAYRAPDLHRRLLATGATAVLGTQAFWNMLVVVGAAPTKGLTLPFVSYGGSSIIVCLMLIGILDACARAEAGLPAARRGETRIIGATTALRARREAPAWAEAA
ncbi:MAG: FtsW/RodA/SpoVE family cell cycle protein [Planctomycetota bacterium]|nr:FtsW/RodA/SpoVE family cell cycle protein [Planctomycetota bacterium]MDW8372721.1 FtsW/RodA/SpoVE family cell cycle protein [Planctomycetota bacterium]